jgi:hypothetical protein
MFPLRLLALFLFTLLESSRGQNDPPPSDGSHVTGWHSIPIPVGAELHRDWQINGVNFVSILPSWSC